MSNTYQLIARQSVGSGGASSVTFSSIPQNFTDLKVVVSGRNAGNYFTFSIGLNGTTVTGFRRLFGTGSGASSDTYNGMYIDYSSAVANTFGNAEFYIPNYTSSNAKSISVDAVSEDNASSAYMNFGAGLLSTSAVTSITFTPETGNFAENSEFSLYGISNVGTQSTNVPYASGGDIIVNDGTYWYHAFKYSGVFTPIKNLTCDYLVIAGGGGGGGYAGGGGAGGLRSTVTATGGGGSLESVLSLTAQSYTVTIGAGGAGGATGNGINGSNSVFASITSIGGGYGGGYSNEVGNTGGSGGGGGAGDLSTTNVSGGSGTTNQGYAGGYGRAVSGTVNGRAGGGGGGAGSVGSNASSGIGGNGGSGVAISALATATGTGVSNYYAGGGAGGYDTRSSSGGYGTGGSGGGGNGGGYSAINNTGSGGGGGAFTSNWVAGGNGGSGLIIVRYAI